MNRNELLGDDLTKTLDAISVVVRRHVPAEWVEDADLLFKLFGDFWALTLGRATVLAAGAVRAVDDKVEALGERVTALEKQVGQGDGNL